MPHAGGLDGCNGTHIETFPGCEGSRLPISLLQFCWALLQAGKGSNRINWRFFNVLEAGFRQACQNGCHSVT